MTKKITPLQRNFCSSLFRSSSGNKSGTTENKGLKRIFLTLLVISMTMFNQALKAQCLVAVNGLWPSTTYTPTCTGSAELITSSGYASEYSNVNLIGGQSYTFTSSVSTDIITISDAAGITAVAFGTGTVTYTPGSSAVYRFYTHLAGCAAASVSRSRNITCTLSPCTSPTDSATGLTFSGMGASTIPGTFSAAIGAPSGYLVVRYSAGATPTNPVDGTTYTTGAALGTGTVVQASASLTFTATGLTPSTAYDFYIYSYNVTAGVCSINYLNGTPLRGNSTTSAAATFTSTAAGGLWNNTATWVGGVIPTSGNHVVIVAGSVVTVDMVINVVDLTISGVLQWNGTSNTPTINGNLLINSGGRLLPYTSSLGTLQFNFGGNFTNNGYTNLGYCILNTTGSGSQSLAGTGTFQADGAGRGIIRQIACSSLNTVTVNTTQNLVVTLQIAIPNNFNPNGKVSIDNTANIYGQSLNLQVANMVVTNMGSAYSAAPEAVASGASRWIATTAVAVGNVRFAGGNQYVCTIAGTTGSSAPVHTSGTAASGSATLLWVGSTGKIGNAFILAATVGTQYFYNGNLYTCTVSGTASAAAPPVHSSGTVASGTASFRYAGTVATCTVNYDAGTSTVRSLTMTSPGSGYSSAPTTTIASVNTVGSGAAVTNVYIQQLAGQTIATCGRGVSSSYTTPFSAINNSQGVGSIAIASGGNNYTVAPSIGMGFPTSQNLVTAGGSGYTSAPTVTISGGTTVTGFVNPTFTVGVNQGKVVSVYVSAGGSGWLTPPTLTFTGGGGSGATLAFPSGCLATATAVIGANGQITAVTVTNAGNGYTAAPTCLLAGGTFTTAASSAPVSRVGIYNVVYNWYAPVSASGTITEGNELASDRRMNNLSLVGVIGVNMSGNVTLTGTAPLTLTNGLLDMAGNNIMCTWRDYAGLSTTSLVNAITNASMTLTGRGGGTFGSTWNYPFVGGNVTVFTGSGTDGSNGSSILTCKVTRLTSPSGGSAGSSATGKEAFRVQPGASEVYGLNPTVSLRWNTNDSLTIPGSACFVGQSTALSGPTWTIRSAAVGGGALSATGTLATATSGAGPFAPTGDDYFSFVTDLVAPIVTTFSPASGCANASIITITGTGFTGITAGSVTIGGTPVASIVSFTNTEIVAQVGAGTTGLVSVTTAGGVAVSSGTFTVGSATVAAPVMSPSNGLVCIAGGSVNIDATTAGAVSYSWAGTGLSSYSAPITVASPSVTTQYTSIIDMGTCVASFLVNVGVISGASPSPSATPPYSCYSSSGVVTLNANLSSSSFGVSSIAYDYSTPPGSGVTSLSTDGVANTPLTSGTLDDGGWSTIPLGFTYNFFGNNYTSINVGTNGVIQFGAYSAGDLGDFTYVGLPSVGEPANIIAPMASDMDLRTKGRVRYWSIGIAPTRVFILDWDSMGGYSGTNGYHTMQLKLYETTGNVEVHVKLATKPAAKTIGLQDLTRTIGATAPGRNDFTSTITVPEAWRFIPPASYTYLWTPGGSAPTSGITTETGLPASLTPYVYTVQVTNPTTGCIVTVPDTFYVNDIPAAPSVSPGSVTVLEGDTVSFTASGLAGATFAWYSAASGGTLIPSSAGVLRATSCTSGSGTSIFYAEQTSGVCVSATRTAVTLSLNTLTIPTATSSTECSNPIIPTCFVTATSGVTVPKFKWYSAASGGTLLQTGTSNTYLSAISATTTFYVSEINGGCESPRVAVTSTLPSLAVALSPSTGLICSAGGSVSLSVTPTMGGSTITWTGGAGLSTYSGASTVASPSVSTLYTVTEVLGACSLSAIANVGIIVGVNPAPTAIPSTLLTCAGPIQLDAGLSTTSFTVASTPYVYTPVAGGAVSLATNGVENVTLTSGSLDDGGWAAIPLGFTYNYFGNNYTTINVGTNGVVQFGAYSAGDLGDFTYVGLPSVGEPANIIAPMASDMDLRTIGRVKYWTEGTAPTRMFILDWDSMGGYSGANGYHTMQLKLYETTGIVEVHVKLATKPAAKTIGLQDLTRLIGTTAPGRSTFTSTITVPEAWRFTPPAAFTFTWSPTTGLSSSTISNPVISSFTTPGTRVYTVAALNTTTGCTTSAPVSIFVNNITSTIFDTISSGSSYLFNAIYRTTSGSYPATFTSYLGCDSIVTLNLHVLPAIPGDVLCDPISFAGTGVFHETSPRNLASTNPDCDTLEGTNRYASTEATEPIGSAAGGGPGTSVTSTFSYTGAMASYTVPSGVSTLSIEAFGAQGGSAAAGFVGGLGARMKGSFSVSPGDQLLYIVGGQGINGGSSAGGGGGTFVAKVDPASPDIIASGPFAGLHVTPLIIAGGGGGLRTAATSNGNPGVVTNTATTASGSLSAGGGAVSGTTPGLGGIVSSSSWGSAGAGFTGNGALDVGNGLTASSSFLNAGIGGSGICSAGGINGGFGGGGTGGGCQGGGGGGGYTGGDGGWVAGGGGSYNIGTSQSNTAGVRSGNGELIFIAPGSVQRSMWYSMTAPTCAASSIRFSTNTIPTNFDTRLTAYHRTTPSICTTGYVELASNNDDGVSPMPAASSIVLTPGSGAASSSTYAPGQPVYVQLTGYGGAYGDYGVIVDVDAPDLTLGTVTSSSIAVNLPPAALAVGPVSNIYLRYRIAGIGGSSYGQIILPSSTTSRVISGLVSGSSYDIWAMYRCAADDRWVTKKITASTVAGCTASTSPTVDTSGSCTSVRVSWTTAPLVSRYVVYWRVIGYAGYGLRRVDSLTTSTVISGLTAGANYEFWVSTVCTGGAIATSVRTPFSTCGALARRSDATQDIEEGIYAYNNLEFHHMPITDIANMIEANDPTATEVKLTTLNGGEETSPSVSIIALAENLSIYPNPAQTEATISYLLPTESDMMTIRVFDVQGKEMMNEVIKEPSMIGSYDIQLSNYAGGIYLVKVQANNFSETRKLIVDKD